MFCECVFPSSTGPSILTFAASIAITMAAIHLIHLLLCCFQRRYRRYDVFLSFRGRDVRKGFVDHLYHALTGEGFRVFLDTHHLQRGEDISASLQRAIEVSHILIPIFLHQLRRICMVPQRSLADRTPSTEEGIGHRRPSFLQRDSFSSSAPGRSQDGPYREAFQEHENSGKYSPQKIDEWKAALFTLSNLSGWSLQEDMNGYETAMVKRVVEYVANTL